MALSTRGKIIALWATTIGVVAFSIVAMEVREAAMLRHKKDKTLKASPLSGVYAADAVLPSAIAADITLPIVLSVAPRTKPTPMVTVVDGTVNDPLQLGVLITDLTPEKAQLAYDFMNGLVVDGYDMSEPGTLDGAIKQTVEAVAPRVDWSQGLMPYSYESPEARIWRGVQMLGELAYQSYWNKQAAPSA